MSNKAEIFIRFTFAGFHCWESAPEHRSYLASRHRHLFGVEVKCLVNNDDREIEFHDLLDESKAFFSEPERGNQSCEMMARALGEHLAKRYQRSFTVMVSEDGECGAQVVTET
ncbi:hypothetical protein ICN32_11545 [Polynucleobacter wuianus]|uniref:hypothetical protein n=1 Tax=Polynucleobacter wuianus TaxID=1743168 RepID=UPI001C0E0FF9|nr:hypothetical protein [Polynucleobacter wuianus]MBU3611186.1 hypothetical protein [Polynucleobacter wuianus]